MKTYVAKPSTIEKKWYIVDAKGHTLGRLATVVADCLRGKRKTIYTPHIDTGDFVVVINAEHIIVTGKKPEQKMYYHHSGYPGGLRSESYANGVSFASGRYNVCTGRAVSLNQVLEIYRELFPGAPAAEYAAARIGDIRHSLGDPDLLRCMLGFGAEAPFASGLRELAHWA